MSHQTLVRQGTRPTLGSDMAVAIYPTHREAESAVKALRGSSLDMRQVSLVGRDYHTDEHVVGYYSTGDHMRAWGKFGRFWDGMWGLLYSSAFFEVPGTGPVLLAGPLVAAVVSGLEAGVTVGSVGVLGTALVNMGLTNESALAYEAQIQVGKYILIVHGAEQEVADAKGILETTSHEGTARHSA